MISTEDMISFLDMKCSVTNGKHRSMYEAIRAAFVERQWKDISTAPRDGTWILAYWPTMSIQEYAVVVFADNHSLHDIWYMPHNLEYGCVYPTHWMELFKPPEGKIKWV